jgi:hypothetical protein
MATQKTVIWEAHCVKLYNIRRGDGKQLAPEVKLRDICCLKDLLKEKPEQGGKGTLWEYLPIFVSNSILPSSGGYQFASYSRITPLCPFNSRMKIIPTVIISSG